MTSDIDITVAICTYNGADRVPEVLDHLHVQEGVEQVDWEVLVVDNNSTDETAEVVAQNQSEWPDDVPLRYVFEGRSGKSNAIQTAADEARGKWIAFLDDDNLPAPDWVASALAFGKAHPKAGAFGGQIHGLFEEAPPNSFGLVKPLFALNERSETVCYSHGRRLEFAAPGAGLVVRKQAWEESIPESGLKLLGPTGEGRGTLGEEFEIQWKLYQNGWEIWHNPTMHLQHKIPASRFTESYLKSFFRGIGLSRHYTRMMQFPWWQRPFATVGYWASDLLRLIQLTWTYRQKVMSDRFVRGRVAMTFYMLLAPFRSNP